jgi:hypothetical protein
VDAQGWFSTGDVASIDQHGTMKISDRCVNWAVNFKFVRVNFRLEVMPFDSLWAAPACQALPGRVVDLLHAV